MAHRKSTIRDFRPEGRKLPPPLALTILAHRDPRRVGDHCVFSGLKSKGGSVDISRTEPTFVISRRPEQPTGPLDDLRISRQPEARITVDAQGTSVAPAGTDAEIYLEGVLLRESVRLSEASLERGVTLLFGHHICLLLHDLDDIAPRWAHQRDGMVGMSAGLQRARRSISQAAESDEPVLIRGENGCGKELAAQSIHRQSPRARKKLRAINVAALQEDLVTAELFGTVSGAFTHAKTREGYFEAAAGSSLLLDEIGSAALSVQQRLYRAVEQRTIQRVGSHQDVPVDVRLIAATDQDLESAMAERAFLAPLYHRLNYNSVLLPPLRERREDIPRLLYHFARQELEKLKRSDLLAPAADGELPWIPGWLIDRLTRYAWPGNVRELRGVVLKLVRNNLERPHMVLPRELEGLLEATALRSEAPTQINVIPDPKSSEPPPSSALTESPTPAVKARKARTSYRDIDSVTDEELEEALEKAKRVISKAAELLGVHRTALDKRIQEHPTLRRAKDLSWQEIQESERKVGPDPRRIAEFLKVGVKALKDHQARLRKQPRRLAGPSGLRAPRAQPQSHQNEADGQNMQGKSGATGE